MKTLRSIALGVAMLVSGGTVYAAGVTHHEISKDEVVGTYINAIVHGNLKDVDQAIADDAQFYTIRGTGTRVDALTKKQVMDYLKSNASLNENCECTSTMLKDDDNTFVEKVDMKYDNVTRTDVITAERDGNDWKITKVETSYK
ncbi:MAG: hypothetical protein JST19_20695 [Bacteroidetes bacterium]|nr:hypothetical protein [Bacteroidota bacterium]